MKTIIYGIKNCSTMKKAFDKLEALGVPYEFFDYRKQSPDISLLHEWVSKKGIDKILNRKGVTWRNLSNEEKQQATQDEQFAIELMSSKPSMIKRPIITQGEQLLIGYDGGEMNTLA